MPSAMLLPPVLGWNTRDPLSAMEDGYAVTLDNMLPTADAVRVRRGWSNWATGLAARVDGLLSYRSGVISKLFAASGGGIYDVTATGAVGGAVVSGLTSALVDGVTMNATGGNFLLAYNGADTPRVFDGAAWSVWSATGIPSGVSWALPFKGRLWCGDGTTMGAWYGGVASIAGAFTAFPIRGIARRGGGIIGAAAWTRDGGSGTDDQLALFTSEGEVLLYGGLDPAGITSWGLIGRYDCPRPVGRRFLRAFGGDVLVLTVAGVFTLSTLLAGVEQAALAEKALTKLIGPTFRDLTRARAAMLGWDMAGFPGLGLWIVNLPWNAATAQQVVFNASTGAAARWTGVPAACWLEHEGRAFFGHAGLGQVAVYGEADADNGIAIGAEALTAFSSFGAPGMLKRFTLAQPVLVDSLGASVRLDMALDWTVPDPEAITLGPGAPPVQPSQPATVGIWGTSTWGNAMWAGPGGVVRAWRAVRGIGQAGAVRLRLVSSVFQPGWVGQGVVYERGGPLR